MDLKDIIRATYKKDQEPNAEQLKAIESTAGPLLIIAGPGSGKTKTLITRALYLLITKEVKPESILLCTFTEKAARQLRDKLNAGLNKCGITGIDIHEMAIGTIHSICQKIIDEYPNEAGKGIYSTSTGLGRGYAVLDDLQRMFFLMDNFHEIYEKHKDHEGKYLGRWKPFWGAIENSQGFFDKITEENIDLAKLRRSRDNTVKLIGKAMTAYRKLLVKNGKADFAHLEWFAYDLLLNYPAAQKEFQNKFEYVMVDEYQDTNYIQEQIIFTLADKNKNIAVVGDVDQSIYRFRGATTQNILEFPTRVGSPDLKPVNLGINYRSSQQIIDLYQGFRDEIDWVGNRYDLEVIADGKMEKARPEYKALIRINEDHAEREGNKVADLIHTLKKAGTITDYNQAAILLYSVRENYSEQYINAINALKDTGIEIDVYAPRAKMFFERVEVMCALAALHSINPISLSAGVSGYPGSEGESLGEYIDRCVNVFRDIKTDNSKTRFLETIRILKEEIEKLKSTEGKPKKRFLEYFYSIVNSEFFNRWMDVELPARHIAQISRLIDIFTEYYGYEWVSGKYADKLWDKFFNKFLRVLINGGLNEYEDKEENFPSGAVQIMTYHQSKGLEFPVVIVGGLHAQITTARAVDDLLEEYYNRDMTEPRELRTEFDRQRLNYVAFSRAKDFLVLTYHSDLTERVSNRLDRFENSLKMCKPWDDVKKDGSYKRVKADEGDSEKLKPVFGFTSHISAYERCPRQFQYQKIYEFASVRSEQLWMGNVVHNTLKDIHDHILKKKSGKINDKLVDDYLELNIHSLERSGVKIPKAKDGVTDLKDIAFKSIKRYVDTNKNKLENTRWAEKEILVDATDYSLTGVIDLLIDDKKGTVELVDFKAGQRKNNEQYRDGYADQIRLYCSQVESKIGKKPDSAYLYWVTETDKTKVVDEVDIKPELLEGTKKRVRETADKIVKKEFPKLKKKDKDLCGVCELCEKCWN